MKKDKTQDKYEEITKDLQEEKMNWDFEDFLKETKKEEKIIPLISKNKGGNINKFYWLAASLLLLLSVGFFFKYSNEKPLIKTNNLVKNNNQTSKDSLNGEINLANNTISDTIKVKTNQVDSDSTSTVEKNESQILDQILPKRGRIRKEQRPRYAKNLKIKKPAAKAKIENTDYESNYVIINGQKIENEQEAIDLTKYSFRILSENVSKTMAQTDVINNLNDY